MSHLQPSVLWQLTHPPQTASKASVLVQWTQVRSEKAVWVCPWTSRLSVRVRRRRLGTQSCATVDHGCDRAVSRQDRHCDRCGDAGGGSHWCLNSGSARIAPWRISYREAQNGSVHSWPRSESVQRQTLRLRCPVDRLSDSASFQSGPVVIRYWCLKGWSGCHVG
jgi:hypothetical protein